MTHKNLFLTGVLAATLIVAGCGGGGGGSSSAETPLSNLYGRLSLNYATDGVAKFSSVIFSSSNLTTSGSLQMLVNVSETDSTRSFACRTLTDNAGKLAGYLCATGTQAGEVDYFLFQLDTNRQLFNGTHEYCSATETFGGTNFIPCQNDLVSTPDSSVTGSVTSITGVNGASLPTTNILANTDSLQAALKAYKP